MPSAAGVVGIGNKYNFGPPKIIYFGQGAGIYGADNPTPQAMVNNSSVVRSRAAQFDGTVVGIPGTVGEVLSPSVVNASTINTQLSGWAAADFGTVTRNWGLIYWLGTNYGPDAAVATDWTNNTHWAQIAANFGTYATCLKNAGKFTGIFFDNEAYGSVWNQNTYPWNWGGDSNQPTQTAANGLGILPSHSRPAALALAYQRGQEIMDAILTAWPECHVMGTHSFFASDYYAGEAMNLTLATGWNNLWWTSELKGPLAYGMLSKMWEKKSGYLWDGGEMYGLRSQTDQYKAVRFRKYVAPRVANQWTYTDPLDKYRILVSQGMFDRDEFNSFNLQPASAIKNQLIWAGRENDTYIWLYTEEHNWWGVVSGSGKTAAPQAYLDAVAEARTAIRGGNDSFRATGGVQALNASSAGAATTAANLSGGSIAMQASSAGLATVTSTLSGGLIALQGSAAGVATASGSLGSVGTTDNARRFNGTSNVITTSAGDFNGVPFDFGTVFVIFRWDGTQGSSWRELASTNGAFGLFVSLTPSGTFTVSLDGSSGTASNFVPSANTWYFASYTKLSGTQTPYYNVWNYTTQAWSTSNHGSTMTNGAQNISNFYISSFQGSSEFWPGDIAAMGFFRHFLPSSAGVQAAGFHTAASNWVTFAENAGATDRSAWWTLNQVAASTALTDRSGGGANETSSNVGTVITGPDGWDAD